MLLFSLFFKYFFIPLARLCISSSCRLEEWVSSAVSVLTVALDTVRVRGSRPRAVLTWQRHLKGYSLTILTALRPIPVCQLYVSGHSSLFTCILGALAGYMHRVLDLADQVERAQVCVCLAVVCWSGFLAENCHAVGAKAHRLGLQCGMQCGAGERERNIRRELILSLNASCAPSLDGSPLSRCSSCNRLLFDPAVPLLPR